MVESYTRKAKQLSEGERLASKETHQTQPDPDDLVVAARVFEIESSALLSLSNALDAHFSRAVTALFKTTGRIIVSGMGKSGHIARKIAASLSSTGSPAQFVHPAEASHGDLGMIRPHDSVLMLSNSGENRELGDLIAHAKRFAIPLIGISSKASSTLMEAADIKILLPSVPEACPMGLAPTTSTTMMMALGDALTVALMERRGFSADDYRVLHPGGQLGKSLVRVRDIMHGPDALPLVPVDASMSTMLLEMTAKRFGCVGILGEDQKLLGIFTDGDLGRHMNADLLTKSARDVLTKNPKTIRPSALIAEAVGFMSNAKITCLFVVDDDVQNQPANMRPVGILHMHDCLRAGVA